MIGSGSENFLRAKSDPRMKVNSRSNDLGSRSRESEYFDQDPDR